MDLFICLSYFIVRVLLYPERFNLCCYSFSGFCFTPFTYCVFYSSFVSDFLFHFLICSCVSLFLLFFKIFFCMSFTYVQSFIAFIYLGHLSSISLFYFLLCICYVPFLALPFRYSVYSLLLLLVLSFFHLLYCFTSFCLCLFSYLESVFPFRSPELQKSIEELKENSGNLKSR